MAILEFSSSNGLSSFNINFECRSIEMIEIEDENNNYFSYVVKLPLDLRSDPSCDERGYKEYGYTLWNGKQINDCITTFQGKKCSMI